MSEAAPIARTTTECQALDTAQQLHPFSNRNLMTLYGARIITGGEGVYLWASEGPHVLDGFARICNVALGCGRQELLDATARQIRELTDYNHHFSVLTPPSIELAEKITETTRVLDATADELGI